MKGVGKLLQSVAVEDGSMKRGSHVTPDTIIKLLEGEAPSII